MKDTMIGVDLAKSVFVLHAATMAGEVRYRKKLGFGQITVSIRIVHLSAIFPLGHSLREPFEALCAWAAANGDKVVG